MKEEMAKSYLENFIDAMKSVYEHEWDGDRRERGCLKADVVKESILEILKSRKDFENISGCTLSIRSDFIRGLDFHLERSRRLQCALGKLVNFEYQVELLKKVLEEK